jgi:hypothetical protein
MEFESLLDDELPEWLNGTQKFRWISEITGELQRNILGVIRNLVCRDCYGNIFFNLKWKRWKG